jgi:hypothetical protein
MIYVFVFYLVMNANANSSDMKCKLKSVGVLKCYNPMELHICLYKEKETICLNKPGNSIRLVSVTKMKF